MRWAAFTNTATHNSMKHEGYYRAQLLAYDGCWWKIEALRGQNACLTWGPPSCFPEKRFETTALYMLYVLQAYK